MGTPWSLTVWSAYHNECLASIYASKSSLSIVKQQLKCEKIYISLHYENTPNQYSAIFHSLKNDNFQMKNCNIFLISAQNIDSGYALEPPH